MPRAASVKLVSTERSILLWLYTIPEIAVVSEEGLEYVGRLVAMQERRGAAGQFARTMQSFLSQLLRI